MSAKTGEPKTEGDMPIYHIHSIPQPLLLRFGKPDSNAAAASTSKEYFKTSARDITSNFDKHLLKLFTAKGNAPSRLFRMFNLKRAMESDPSRDWSTIVSWAADLENFHADVSSILVAGKTQLLMTMTFDPTSLKRLGTTVSELLHDLPERNFVVERTLPLSGTNSNIVKELIESGKFSIALTHPEIKKEEHLYSDYVGSLSINGHTNGSDVSLNTLRQRELPKLAFVSVQQLTPANAEKKVQAGAVGISEKQGKKYETTTYGSIDSIGLKTCDRKKLHDELADFQRNGFKETRVTVNSKRTVTIKLVPWNHFDSQGRSAYDRA